MSAVATSELLESASYIAALMAGIFAVVYFAKTRRPVFRSLGLTVDRWLPVDLGVGLIIPFLALSGVFVAEFLLRAITLSPGGLTPGTLARDLGLLLVAAAAEELLFRVFLLSAVVILLSRLRYGRWIAVALTAVVFGVVHLSNPGATALTAFGTGLGGIIYGVAFLSTRSVWLPFALHVSWNLSQGLWGFPISGQHIDGWFSTDAVGPVILTGGSYGPEAGILGMLARVVVIVLVLVYVKRRWPHGSIATLRFAPDPVKTARR